MRRTCLGLALGLLLATPVTAGSSGWVKIPTEDALVSYIFHDADWTKSNYPTKVDCRSRGGALEAKFNYVRGTKATKPYHKWNATLQREGETQAQAAARLPVRDHPQVKYQVKFGCRAAGKTLLVAFRGTRALD